MIIHKIYYRKDKSKGYTYLCNWAIGNPSMEKCSYQWKKVTCKNCLQCKDEDAKRGDQE